MASFFPRIFLRKRLIKFHNHLKYVKIFEISILTTLISVLRLFHFRSESMKRNNSGFFRRSGEEKICEKKEVIFNISKLS